MAAPGIPMLLGAGERAGPSHLQLWWPQAQPGSPPGRWGERADPAQSRPPGASWDPGDRSSTSTSRL